MLLTGLVLLPLLMKAQAVYEPVPDNPVYELLDELAGLKVITINSAVKPYSRVFIANMLKQALQNVQKLDKRQREEVEFYLRDYGFEKGLNNNLINGLTINSEIAKRRNSEIDSSYSQVFSYDPVAITYPGKIFKIRAAPWLGTRLMMNENGTFKEFSGGGEIYGYVGKHIGYYTNIKYVWESEPMVNPIMFTMEEGKSWNYMGNGSVGNTEWRGGISVGWKWGEFGLFKDRPVWGNAGHGSNIMSGHAPSFPYVQLHLKPAKWIEFYSITGFLKSNVVDSSRSNFTTGSEQIKYRRKYCSANFFTVTPWKGLDISFGNSIFWSDVFKVAYLIPFNLYKSVDQTLKGSLGYVNGFNTNDDGHLYLDISSRNIRHLNLYLGLWIDEWQTARIFQKNQHNLLSWKAGVTLYDIPVKNLSVTIEGVTTRPGTYEEYNPANLYANDDYNFGNYLRGDAWELYVCFNYRPVKGLKISALYDVAQRGGYVYGKDNAVTYPVDENLIFNESSFEFSTSYILTTNVRFFFSYTYNIHSGDVQYIPQIMRGITNSVMAGTSIGF